LVVNGRAKKNFKSADLVLAALFKLLIPESVQGNDCYILANDEDQAGDDLGLAKKLVEANAVEIGAEVEIQANEIKRKDGRGSLQILRFSSRLRASHSRQLVLGIGSAKSAMKRDCRNAVPRTACAKQLQRGLLIVAPRRRN
jgi:phage terminase large subunit-like protein